MEAFTKRTDSHDITEMLLKVSLWRAFLGYFSASVNFVFTNKVIIIIIFTVFLLIDAPGANAFLK
jgi:hypothetical protein